MNGISRIAAERQRQIEVEGWSAEHDAQHFGGELALAAMYYVMPEVFFVEPAIECIPWHDGKYTNIQRDSAYIIPEDIDRQIGWNLSRDKKSRLRQLEIAGALIAAEIDRLLALGGARFMNDHILSAPFKEWCNSEHLKANVCPGKDHMHPDTPPVTAEERAAKRAIVSGQIREIGTSAKVTCQCGVKIPVIWAYRCWYCGVWFCEKCAREHFNVPEGFFRGDPAIISTVENKKVRHE